MKTKKSISIISIFMGIFILIFSFLYTDNNTSYVYNSRVTISKVTEGFTYADYYNSRYEFSIKYPSILINGNESENGDGITLIDESGMVKLTVFGSNNIFDITPSQAYKNALKEVKKASYKKQKDNWYAISWIKDNKIIYKKEVVGKGSINTLIFEYPLTQKKLYDEFLLNLNNYFKTPGIHEVH
ncbi:hypothetical protein [Clostridium thailandense]|uniref:hypothetical protein n=1 Tax=Clostridium thailandense TaxID=2794346 RepID=UPI00398980BB